MSFLSFTYANVTANATSRIANPVAASQEFNMFVTDALGNTSVVSNTMTSYIGLGGCNTPTPTPTPVAKASSFSLGGAIGGVLGGVFAALAALALGLWLLRRKRAKEAEAAQAAELSGSYEYRGADGTAPLVIPFVLPTDKPERGSPSSYTDPYSPADDYTTVYDNQSPTDSRRASSFGYPPPGPPRTRQGSDYSTGKYHQPYSSDADLAYDHMSSAATEAPVSPYESHDPLPGTQSYPVYGHDAFEEASDSVDGLAHPASFNYR